MEILSEIQVELTDDLYKWVLNEVGSPELVEPYLTEAIKDFIKIQNRFLS